MVGGTIEAWVRVDASDVDAAGEGRTMLSNLAELFPDLAAAFESDRAVFVFDPYGFAHGVDGDVAMVYVDGDYVEQVGEEGLR